MDEHTSPAVFMGGCLSFAEYGLLKGLIWKIVIIFYNILVETATKLSYYHSKRLKEKAKRQRGKVDDKDESCREKRCPDGIYFG